MTDPWADHQTITETFYVNLPAIALGYVDLAITCHNKKTPSMGPINWVVVWEVLDTLGIISHKHPQRVGMPDLYFYRDLEEMKSRLLLREGCDQGPGGSWVHCGVSSQQPTPGRQLLQHRPMSGLELTLSCPGLCCGFVSKGKGGKNKVPKSWGEIQMGALLSKPLNHLST